MKATISILSLILSMNLLAETYKGSSFNGVWDLVTKSKHSSLPQTKVTLDSFFNGLTNLLSKAAKETVKNKNDIRPYFNKLLHSNGICMKGTWDITRENPYSGYFKKGSKALIIARASTTLSNTRRGSLRGFGLAGKIFPTLNEDQSVKTGNFFLIDNLVGTYAKNFTRVNLGNQPGIIPAFSFTVPFLAPIGFVTAKAFALADINPGVRQVYSISHLGINDPRKAKTPKWMMIRGSNNEVINSKKDFRAELIKHMKMNKKVSFDIFVANDMIIKKWDKIGVIAFDKIISSKGCDHRLHFHHHKFKTTIK